ncbi:MAG: UDP-N-acetylmuramate:L-alanyl-gamma-D-glutamyl-meso-diaminopimelate ligase, partial [Gammaproteobacteria bacterium]|nr:UDP-N-acetylmuramate:L-alanyl-gamma-D-glutamyl-meso-diaminopimelate ligase [Gammaproteobacteria bacterium]
MHIHILGIAGTFMAGIARLARECGHEVTGSDSAVYPPMSTQLEALGIDIIEGYAPEMLPAGADLFVIGNVMSRGNPAVEYILDQRLPYESGAAWLAREVLPGRQVLAVAGTHGKTTTASILAYLLDSAGLQPGFMIGGVPECFGVSARSGGEYFVIEADEYDTAFFDKRSKFVHYRPGILVLNNLEFDHADIFPDLDAIKWQFHQLLRCVPASGRLIVRDGDAALAAVLDMGCWTRATYFGLDGGDWRITDDGADCVVTGPGGAVQIATPLLGT